MSPADKQIAPEQATQDEQTVQEKQAAQDWRLKFLRARCGYLEDKIRSRGGVPMRHLIAQEDDAAMLALTDYVKALELQYKLTKKPFWNFMARR